MAGDQKITIDGKDYYKGIRVKKFVSPAACI